MPAPPSLDPPRPAALPEQFGPYLLVAKIGEGGMAEVFRAKTFGGDGFERTLVIKRMRAELSRMPEMVRMFTDEAKITALLDHPNVVRVLDFGHVAGRVFMAMELLDGVDLAVVMRALRPAGISLRGPLVARIALGIARGLEHAHTARDHAGRPCGIVHRDVNPANIMLLHDGGVKVLDFGIAKAAQHVGKAQTGITKLKGKLGYVSPEQALGDPLDGRSDVFSLGVTMWELLTGERLFVARKSIDKIRKVLYAPIVPPSARRPAVDATLDGIVMRALERDRARRYASAAALADDLGAFLAAHPSPPEGIARLLARIPAAGADGPRAAAARARGAVMAMARRRAFRWVAGAALCAGVAVLAAVHLTGRAPASAVAAPAVLPPVVKPAPPAAAEAETVRVEIQSEPSGVVVNAGPQQLGITPLTASFSRSSRIARLAFRARGFVTETYDFRPESDGLVFVELRPARAPARPRAAVPRPKAARRHAGARR